MEQHVANSLVERDNVRNVRKCDASAERGAQSDIVKVFSKLGIELEAAKSRIKELEAEMKTKENFQNSGSTVDILEAALKDADSNINILSREKLELLEQIEKIKTKFEVADILVEKSRQLELATAAEVEADRATKEAKVQELEARLQVQLVHLLSRVINAP